MAFSLTIISVGYGIGTCMLRMSEICSIIDFNNPASPKAHQWINNTHVSERDV
jgi:hypothetical protein